MNSPNTAGNMGAALEMTFFADARLRQSVRTARTKGSTKRAGWFTYVTFAPFIKNEHNQPASSGHLGELGVVFVPLFLFVQ